MDPNYFFVDWEKLGEVLSVIIVLSFFIERSLSLFFESDFFINKVRFKSTKELIAFIVSFIVCWFWKFDAISILLSGDSTTIFGYAITGAIIAGGSKASLKLFRDILNVKSNSQKFKEAQNANAIQNQLTNKQ